MKCRTGAIMHFLTPVRTFVKKNLIQTEPLLFYNEIRGDVMKKFWNWDLSKILRKWQGMLQKESNFRTWPSFSVQEGGICRNHGASSVPAVTLLSCISTIDTVNCRTYLSVDGTDGGNQRKQDYLVPVQENLGFISSFNLLDTLTISEKKHCLGCDYHLSGSWARW